MSTSTFQCLAGGSQAGQHSQVQTSTPHLPLLPPTAPPGFPGGQGPHSPEWVSPPVSAPLPAGSLIHQPLARSTAPPLLLLPAGLFLFRQLHLAALPAAGDAHPNVSPELRPCPGLACLPLLLHQALWTQPPPASAASTPSSIISGLHPFLFHPQPLASGSSPVPSPFLAHSSTLFLGHFGFRLQSPRKHHVS